MKVRIEKSFSDALPINGGSPQGTLLGNLIFIVLSFIATSNLDKGIIYSDTQDPNPSTTNSYRTNVLASPERINVELDCLDSPIAYFPNRRHRYEELKVALKMKIMIFLYSNTA